MEALSGVADDTRISIESAQCLHCSQSKRLSHSHYAAHYAVKRPLGRVRTFTDTLLLSPQLAKLKCIGYGPFDARDLRSA
jgi:hypothetical protein